MSKIDYQALREAAERAIPAMERLLMLPVDDALISEQELKDSGCRFNLSMQHPFQLSLSVF